MPRVLAHGRDNLERPARTWTENAIYQAYYAKLLLRDYVPAVCTDDAALRGELVAAAETAWDAVVDFERWLGASATHPDDLPPAYSCKSLAQRGHQRQECTQFVASRHEHHNSYPRGLQVLLILQSLVGGHKRVEARALDQPQ